MKNWKIGEKRKKLEKIKRDKNFKIKFLQDAKFKKIILNIIYVIIMICVLYNVIFSINTSISQKEYFKLYGISLFCMKTDLMEDDIRKNDLVVIKELDDMQSGDIIAYEINGKIRINKIEYLDEEGYATKSNKNYYLDIEKITSNQIIGKKVVNIPFWGLVLNLLQSKIFSFLVLIFLLLVFWYNRNVYTKKKERERKKKKIYKEKNKI